MGRFIDPMVPGHEIVGRVIKVGSQATKFAVGDLAGVGFSSIPVAYALSAELVWNN